MALIKCPECENMVSDKATKCPKCGYPLCSNPCQSKNVEQKAVQEETAESKKLETDKTVQKSINFECVEEKTSSDDKPKKRIIKLLSVICIIVIAVFLVGMVISSQTNVSVSEVDITKWKLVEPGNYYDNYEATVTSNQKKPFVAVLGYYSNTDNNPQFVYLENGVGVFQTLEKVDVDPSVIYTPIGYIRGKAMNETDVKDIKVSVSDYYDNDLLEYSSCTVKAEIKLKNIKSGILFVEITNDSTNEVGYNYKAVVIDGKAEVEYYLSDLPYKSRGVEVSVNPKYFCASDRLKESDYLVEKEYKTERTESYGVTYTGEEELFFENIKDGMLIFSKELTEGGEKEKRGNIENTYSFIEENRCVIRTYDYAGKDEKILTPVYNFNFDSYLSWENLE